MVTKEEIISYIQTIPSSPKFISEAIKVLETGNIMGAAAILSQLPPVVAYMQQMSQNGIQTMQEKNPPINAVLAFFGSKKSKALLYTYLISLTLPKKWIVFDFSNELFFSLNSELLYYWEAVLKSKVPEKIETYISATPLLTASIAICDVIFANSNENIKALRELSELELNDLLYRISGFSIFDIANMVGRKLGFNDEVIKLVTLSEDCRVDDTSAELTELARYLHLLLFYALSRPVYIKSGLNTFVKFEADIVEDVLEEFQLAIGGCEL